jgi:hypothetical protein
MARQFAATSSQYLSVASAPAAEVPLTIACWAKPANTNVMTLVSISNGTSADRFQIVLNSQQVRAGAIGTGLAGIASTSGAFSVNTWFHAAGVFESNSARTAYRDGGNTGTNNLNRQPINMLFTTIGGNFFNDSVGSFCSAEIAEAGIWNAALSPDEIASLAKGVTCDKIRPESLVFYAPLVRDLVDLRGGLAITNNNTATVANHPRVYA